jgi:hypothetical protein
VSADAREQEQAACQASQARESRALAGRGSVRAASGGRRVRAAGRFRTRRAAARRAAASIDSARRRLDPVGMRIATVVVGLCLSAGLAAADPGKAAAPAAAAVPTTRVPCLPKSDSYRLASDNGDPVVCWGSSCMKLVAGEPATMVAPPAPAPAWPGPHGEVRDDGGKPAVCVGTACKPVGAKLAAAIAEERKSAAADQRAPHLAATLDGKAVVAGGAAWSVAKDKPLALKPPSSYAHDDTPSNAGVDVAGNLLVVSWSDRAGPCTVAQLADSSGKNRGKSFAGGDAPFQLGTDRFVVVSEYAEVQIFGLSGKPFGSLPLGTEPTGGLAVALDDSTIAVLRADGDQAYRLFVITPFEDAGVHLHAETFLPICQP